MREITARLCFGKFGLGNFHTCSKFLDILIFEKLAILFGVYIYGIGVYRINRVKKLRREDRFIDTVFTNVRF